MGRHTFRRRNHSRRTLKQRGGALYNENQINYMGDVHAVLFDAVKKLKKIESTKFNELLGNDTSSDIGLPFSKPNKEKMQTNPTDDTTQTQFAGIYTISIDKTKEYVGELCKQLTATKKYLNSLPVPASTPTDGRRLPGQAPNP